MSRKIAVMILIIMMVVSNTPLVFAKDYNTATVESVTGTVSILKAGGEKSITPEKGTILEHGDRIITGKGASLSLKIDDDKYIKVDEKSYLSLSELISSESEGTDTGIKLFLGKIWASITKPLEKDDSFTIETPTAVMGAKGTKFVVKYTMNKKTDDNETSDEKSDSGNDAYEGTSEVVVLEGTVSLQNDGMKKNDAEIFIHKDERAAFTDEVMSEMAREIERALEGGTALEDVDLQVLASQNDTLKKITPEDLDLFTLEAIEESPEGVNETYIEQMDTLKEEKEKEKAKEEQAEQDPRDEKANYDDDVIAPTIGDNNSSNNDSSNDDSSNNNNSGNDTPSTPPAGFRLLSAEIINIKQYNEPFDALKLTFSQAIDDFKYNRYYTVPIRIYDKDGNISDLIFDSEALMGPNDFGDTPDIDIKNDNIIYISLKPSTTFENNPDVIFETHPEGEIKISEGTVVAMDGTEYDETGKFTCIEKIVPIVKSMSYTLANDVASGDGATGEKNITVVFSESLKASDTTPISNIVSNMKLVSPETTINGDFGSVDSSQYDLSQCTKEWLRDDNNEIYGFTLSRLPLDLVRHLPNMIVGSENNESMLRVIFHSDVKVTDLDNNVRHIGRESEEDEDLSLKINYLPCTEMDTKPASIIALEARKDDSASDKVIVDLYFDDYLSLYSNGGSRSVDLEDFQNWLNSELNNTSYANRLFSIRNDNDVETFDENPIKEVVLNDFNTTTGRGVKLECVCTLTNPLQNNDKLFLKDSLFSLTENNSYLMGDLYGRKVSISDNLENEYYLSESDDTFKPVTKAQIEEATLIDKDKDGLCESLHLKFDQSFEEGGFMREKTNMIFTGIPGAVTYGAISADGTCSKSCNILLTYTGGDYTAVSGIPLDVLGSEVSLELGVEGIISLNQYRTIYSQLYDNDHTVTVTY